VGATAGAIGGPLAPITVPAGTAIGSSLGGILGGAFTSSEEKNVSPTVALQPSDFEHSSGTEAHQGYARGGALPVTAPEGKLVGPSHEQGGIALPGGAEAEGGETIDQIDLQSYVFSDRVNVPGTNKSFAEVHERMKEKGAPEGQIKKLAAQQEKVTGRSSNPNATTSGKMATGGFVGDDPTSSSPPPLAGPEAGKSFSPYYNPWTGRGVGAGTEGQAASSGASTSPSPGGKSGASGFGQSSVEEFPFATLGGPSEVPVASPTPVGPSPAPGDGAIADVGTNDLAKVGGSGTVRGNGQAEGGSDDGFDAGSAAATAAQFLPAALNIGRGLFEDSDVGDPQIARVSGENVNTLRRMDTDVNAEPQLNEIDQSLRDVVTNPNVSSAGRQSAFSKSLRAKRKAMAQARREEQRLKNRQTQAIAKAQSQNSRLRSRLTQRGKARNRQQQLRADAAKSNMLSTGIGQLSQTMARRQANEQARRRSTTALMASLAGVDDATKKKQLQAIIPTLPEGRQKQTLQKFLNSL